MSGLGKIASTLDSKQEFHSEDEKMTFVKSSLENSPQPYLLIFDNCDDPAFEDILEYTPSHGPGALLFTSRLVELAGAVESSIDIPLMSDGEAMDIFSARLGRGSMFSSDSKVEAEKVIELLGHLPLAIDQGAAYMKAGRSNGSMSFGTFIEHYRNEKKTIMAHVPRFWKYKTITDEKAQQQSLSVFTTWELSLRNLGLDESDHKSKKHFLTLAAFLDHTRISRVLFKAHARYLSHCEACQKHTWMQIFEKAGEFNNLAFRDVVVELSNLSLVQGLVEEGNNRFYFRIHPLVRDWIKFRIEIVDQQSFACEAARTVDNLLTACEGGISGDIDFSKMITEDSKLLPDPNSLGFLIHDMISEIVFHIDACMKSTEEFSIDKRKLHEIECHFANFYYSSGRLDQASTRMRQPLKLQKEVYGPEEMETLATPGIISIISKDQNKLLEAKEALEDLVRSWKEGADFTSTMMLTYNVAQLYFELEDSAAADDTLTSLVQSVSNLTDSAEYSFLGALTAKLLSGRARHCEAENLLTTLVQRLDKNSQETELSGDLVILLSALGDVLLRQNELKQGEKIFQRIFGYQVRELGPNHPSVLSTRYTGFAQLYKLQTRWADAAAEIEPFYNYITAVGGTAAGGQILNLRLGAAFDLAQCWLQASTTDVERCAKFLDPIISERIKRYSALDKRVLNDERRTAALYYNANLHDRARVLYESILLKRQQLHKPDDVAYLQAEEELANCYYYWYPGNGDAGIVRAVELYESVIEKLEKQKGSNDFSVMQIRQKLGILHSDLLNYEESMRLFKIQLESSECLYGLSSSQAWEARLFVADGYRSLKNYEDAKEQYQKVADWRTQIYGPEDEQTFAAMVRLSHTCSEKGDIVEAEDLYERILTWRTKKYGSEDEKVIMAVDWLAFSQRNLGKYTEAAELYSRVIAWRSSHYGIEDERTRSSAICLAHTLYNAGRFPAAQLLYDQELEWRTKKFGPQHEETISAMDWCAHNKENNGQLSEARDMYETILAWKTETHGPNNRATLTSLKELAGTSFRLEDFPKAKEGFSLLLERSTAELGSEDEVTIVSLIWLARTEMQLENRSVAHEMFLRVLAWTKTNQGNQTETVLGVASEASFPLMAMGRPEEAEADLRALFEWSKREYGFSNFATLRSVWNLGMCMFLCGRYHESAALFEKFLEGKEFLPETFFVGQVSKAVDYLAKCKDFDNQNP